MEKPTSPQKSPYKVKVEKGKTYFGVLVAYLRNNLFAMVLIKKKEILNQLSI